MRLLDRPVWHPLTTRWADHAEGDHRALRLKRDYGVFGAAIDTSPESLAALAALVPDTGELWLVEADPPALPGTRVIRSARCVQMVADAITPGPPPNFDIVPLGEEDAPAMYDLAILTEPGPYARFTHRLGGFVGVKEGDRLVAMAGERMQLPGMSEVSGVCTHPDFRGRGYAGALMRAVATRMLARGDQPFLHAYASNAGAIALYESLGFAIDGEATAAIVGRDHI